VTGLLTEPPLRPQVFRFQGTEHDDAHSVPARRLAMRLDRADHVLEHGMAFGSRDAQRLIEQLDHRYDPAGLPRLRLGQRDQFLR
jgi:hypothetical protein